MAKHLSFIIPMYNVEEYIDRCILSIVDQPIYYDNYELIVVNDGSTDNSRDIVLKLREQYPCIIIIDKDNGGLSSARNLGLNQATGDYIFFVDADDYLSSGSISRILNTLSTSSPDILLFGIERVTLGGRKRKISFHLPRANVMLQVDEYINKYTILSAAWQGAFKRELFIKYNIRMPEGRLAEDDDLVIKIFSVARTVYYEPVCVYNYFQREGSISNSSLDNDNLRLIADRLFIFENLYEYIQSFSGQRYIGLNRKMNYLAFDIIRLLIRKSLSMARVNCTLNKLRKLGFYPLKRSKFKGKYKILSILFNNYLAISFLSINKFIGKFF